MSERKLHIRKATTDDLDFLVRLEQEAFPVFQQTSRRSLIRSIRSQSQEILIAEWPNGKKTAIGSIVLHAFKHALRIYSIALLKSHQNQGIGDQLMNWIRQYAVKNQFERIILEVHASNANLVKWYEERGFSVTGVLQGYYGEGEDGLKMVCPLQNDQNGRKTQNVIVINSPFKWNHPEVNAQVISVRDYINKAPYQNNSDLRVFNLCTSYKYQSYGYYVSLLAAARGQRVIPSIATLRDFRILDMVQTAAYEIDELVNRTLGKREGSAFSMNIYFGQTAIPGYEALAQRLYQLFEAPLFKASFIKLDRWLVKDIRIITFKHIPPEELDEMYAFATRFFNRKRLNYPRLTNYKYDLAILVNPNEHNAPSDQTALKKLRKAGSRKGIYVEFITRADLDKINEFDALFIRETTNVNHHTYEFSRLAYAEGLVVIDDPWSILRCSNKIYQHELFRKNRIRTPETTVLTKNFFEPAQLESLSYPAVLKQPDSAFSLGVVKVTNKEEALTELTRLFKTSDMVICQEFLYSEFDWRIGILDNQPLFACKYYMSKNHWQIYNWKGKTGQQEGAFETLPVDEVPENILHTALKAASLIGDGLYGVDLKLIGDKAYVVEVNDNPNIDSGVEDRVLRDALYERIIDSIIHRIEIARNIRKIKLTDN